MGKQTLIQGQQPGIERFPALPDQLCAPVAPTAFTRWTEWHTAFSERPAQARFTSQPHLS
jgi:hypothetical protein